MKQVVIGMAVALVVVLGAYLLVRPTNAPQTSPVVEVTPTEAPQASAAASPAPSLTGETSATVGAQMNAEPTGANVIKVKMADLRFTPDRVTIKAGMPYKLVLTSSGQYTYTIDQLGINYAVKAGETKSFDLFVSQKGTYDVYSATPGNKEAGMVGKLIVQ